MKENNELKIIVVGEAGSGKSVLAYILKDLLDNEAELNTEFIGDLDNPTFGDLVKDATTNFNEKLQMLKNTKITIEEIQANRPIKKD